MKIAINQPTYLPWLGYFDLVQSADAFVFLDDVKVEKSSWHVRNRIKNKDINSEQYLTIPTALPSGHETLIKDTFIVDNDVWKRKHIEAIKNNYSHSDYYDEGIGILNAIMNYQTISLSDFNINTIKILCGYLGINKKFIRSSALQIYSENQARLVKICNVMNADSYLSPIGSHAYIDINKIGGIFPENNIQLEYQNFKCLEYKQQGDGFLSHMSVIDAIMNIGLKETKRLIDEGHGSPIKHDDVTRG